MTAIYFSPFLSRDFLNSSAKKSRKAKGRRTSHMCNERGEVENILLPQGV